MVVDVTKVKDEAEKELAAEAMEAAKGKIKSLLRKKADAEKILKNIEQEIADAYATLGG